jgi:chemotaxis family two-component system response regulator Rcp1
VESEKSSHAGRFKVKPVEILLVEDNPGDVGLIEEVLKEERISNSVTVAEDGEKALSVLRDEGGRGDGWRPDLILLDLNLPRKSGLELLHEIKGDERLRRIPVIVLTTSMSRQDVTAAYDRHANCYVVKPMDLDQLMRVLKALFAFWLAVVKLPNRD